MEEISRALEDALAYRIAKTVRIRDKWLYGYSIAATTLVLFYIVVLKLGVDKAYLEYEPVSGSVKLDLVGSSQGVNALEEEYCRNIKCRLCDEHDVRYPNTDTLTPLVTTYVREARQRRVCGRNATECPFKSPFQTILWDDYLVAGIQKFEMRVSHVAQAATFFFQSQDPMFRGDSRHMKGRLVARKGNDVVSLKEFPANGQADIITIGEILAAAGLDLDDNIPGHVRPIRETGTSIFCHIRYFNDYTIIAPSKHIEYEYELMAGPGVESVYEPVHLGVAWTSPVDVEERMMLTRRGLKLVWTQEGAIGRFSLAALMVTVLIGLLLHALLLQVGNFIALRLLPRRKVYKMAVEEEVEDTGGGGRFGLSPAGATDRARFGDYHGEYGAIGDGD
mmetsp:Transcript_18856/g.45411  ORF Transcript_18856/g.45411 Transcript_18856/m.45411 type:complete len:392 (-) Transcript_18856:74-1249(-)